MRIHVVLFLFLAASDGIYGCLTWDMDRQSIRFICRIEDDSRTVNLVDNHDQDVARCALNGSSGSCSSFNFVKTIIQENLVTFYIDINQKTDVNGNWTCLQKDNKFISEVITSRELAEITIVNLSGKIVEDDDAQRILLTCSSCRIPQGKNAEFLMNNSSVDSLTFNGETGKCTHLHGECTSDKCSCNPTGNKFTRILLLDRPINTATYFSCDMRFEDRMKSVVFSKVPSVFFNGKEFKNSGTRTVTIQLSDDNNHSKDKESHAAEVVVVVVSIFTVAVILLAVGVYSHRKKRKSEKNRRNGTGILFNEMKNKTDEKHAEETILSNNDSLHCRIYMDSSITETKLKSVQVNHDEDVILHGRSLQHSERNLEPYVTIETKLKSVQVNHDEDVLLHGRSLQHSERNQEPYVTIETNNQSVQVKYEEDRKLPETIEQRVQANFEECGLLYENNGKSIYDDSIQGTDNSITLSLPRTVDQKSNTNNDIDERALSQLSMNISLSRPAYHADAKLDVIFMNCDSLIESKWVLIVAEVLEKEYGLRCGIPGIDTESFKCVSETSKVIITFSEKSARIPDALIMAEFLPVVVIVMVEECSIPIQLTNMKCVDATKDTNTWLNQLLIALRIRKP